MTPTNTTTQAPGLWDLEDYDIILIPSLTYKFYETRNISIIHEERCLEMMKLLDNKNSRIIFVIQTPLGSDIIEHKLRSYDPTGSDPTLKDRLILLSADDSSNKHLTSKILGNDRLIAEIKSHIRDPKKSIMLPYMCTPEDDELRVKLGIPQWLGSAPCEWGSKSNSRKIFAESGVPIAHGSMTPVFTLDALKLQISELHAKTNAESIIMKTDDGCGGYGNVVLDLSSFVGRKLSMADIDRVMRLGVESTKNFEAGAGATKNFDKFVGEIAECGVIVEQMMLPHPGFPQSCPSVQLFIRGDHDVQVLSSHEQVLAGCVYEGCSYPAMESYADRISEYGHAAGNTLSTKGVRGFLGLDFLATQQPDLSWDVIALEINLRLTATSFCFFSMFKALDGKIENKKYLAMDEVILCQNFTVPQLVREMKKIGTGFDYKRGSGVLLITLSALQTTREVSLACVADSKEEVDKLWGAFKDRFVLKENKLVHAAGESKQ